MDFDLSEEQSLLRNGVGRLLADRYGFADRRRYRSEEPGFSEALWADYAGLGLLGLSFAEADGGFGGSAVETMLVMEAFGEALVLEPYLATVVLAGGILRHAASTEQKSRLVPAIADGSLRLAFAHSEPQARYDLGDVETTARRDGAGWVLDGGKALVLHGDSAGTLIVSARTGGSPREPEGLGLFLVDGAASGVSRHGYPTQDGLRAANLTLENVRVGEEAVLGDPGGAYPVISRVIDEAIAAICAEAVGCFGRMQVLTLDYLKTRKQFGTAIGAFQVLQHRAADMFIELEQSRSMAFYASMMAGEDDADERERAVSAAKVQIGNSAKAIGRQAIQLHGGVGMTMEYEVGHHFKRVTMLDTLFGDADHHRKRVARLGGFTGGETLTD